MVFVVLILEVGLLLCVDILHKYLHRKTYQHWYRGEFESARRTGTLHVG